MIQITTVICTVRLTVRDLMTAQVVFVSIAVFSKEWDCG